MVEGWRGGGGGGRKHRLAGGDEAISECLRVHHPQPLPRDPYPELRGTATGKP